MDPTGLADYGLVTIGTERIQVEPDVAGHFRFSYMFDDVQPGDQIEVQVKVFREYGHRDFMNINGQWIQSDSPFDPADELLARDTIRLTVYDTTVELSLRGISKELDPETGVLRILRSDEAVRSVFIDRPHRPGFLMEGPDAAGVCRIRYRPRSREINPTGETTFEFEIHDVAGRRYTTSRTIETP